MYISSDLLLISGGLVTRKVEAREVLSATKLEMKHYINHSKYKWLFLTMCI